MKMEVRLIDQFDELLALEPAWRGPTIFFTPDLDIELVETFWKKDSAPVHHMLE